MSPSSAAVARAVGRMTAATHRLPTPAMMARAADARRKLAMVRLPPGTVVLAGPEPLTDAEFVRIRDEGRRMSAFAFQHLPASLEA